MLGESPEVDNLYLACGLNSVGILSGGGLGHVMAQWLIEEHPPLDVTAVGVDRAHEFQATRLFRQERTVERLGFLLNDMAWPNAQPRLGRNVRRSPYHPQHVADGAHFVATSGWEYPDYFAGPGVTPTVEWGFARGEAFERTREEHLHARDALRDLRPVADVAPPRAGPGRDGRAQPGLRQRRRHRGRPGRLHPVARRRAAGSSPTSPSPGWPRTPTS